MKKIAILSAAVIALGFASCKKDYKCTCTTTPGSSTASVTTLVGVSKGTAKAHCVSSKWTDTSGSYTRTCTLS